ncbi:Uncharacterised protein [uncultured archaeon]|nr:Uncharacterised protein [uncultured archaeon]
MKGEIQTVNMHLYELDYGPIDTNSPEFKAWFGNSIVKNENGSPKMVYHGTWSRKLSKITEEIAKNIPILYHGTSKENARKLSKYGFQPRKISPEENQGQSKYLYLTTSPENAEWFANEKGENTVLEVRNIPYSTLKVDPEDGISDTVEKELYLPYDLPGNVALTRPLGPEHFRLFHFPKVRTR